MRYFAKIVFLISALFALNGCDAQTLNDINNALNNYNGSSYGRSYQQPVYVQPKTRTTCVSNYNAYSGTVITTCR